MSRTGEPGRPARSNLTLRIISSRGAGADRDRRRLARRLAVRPVLDRRGVHRAVGVDAAGASARSCARYRAMSTGWSRALALRGRAAARAARSCARDPALGFVAILFLFAVVWATDIVAYFAGRALGGPKLWPAVSPKRPGPARSAARSAASRPAFLVVKVVGTCRRPDAGRCGVVLSVASQAGDLLESAIKRHFGAKDASQLIPGHGGLMDRLDGFLTAAAAAVMVGLLRGGLDGACPRPACLVI